MKRYRIISAVLILAGVLLLIAAIVGQKQSDRTAGEAVYIVRQAPADVAADAEPEAG